MLRIKRIIKFHNDCLQDTYQKIRLNIIVFVVAQISIYPYIIGNFFANVTLLYAALSISWMGVAAVGLLLLYFIGLYNDKEVNKHGAPSLIKLLKLKRALASRLSETQTRLDAIDARRELDQEMVFDSLKSVEQKE
jgi:hypothetical protein